MDLNWLNGLTIEKILSGQNEFEDIIHNMVNGG